MYEHIFEKAIDRHGHLAVKTDVLEHLYGRTDLQAMWVADMDFEAPDFIMKALKDRIDHPVFGYSVLPEGYWNMVSSWIRERHGWDTGAEWFSFIPGIVKGIGMVINALLAKDEKVIIQPPVYHPFRLVPQGNGREVVLNPLRENADGTYSMDFENLEEVVDEKCRLFILSNPHNPAGIVWDRETLAKLAHFCAARGIIVVSDEIHCDMALFGHKHIPFASVSEEAAKISITFGAPTKTFNLAGIVSSFAIVPDAELRGRFYSWLKANEFDAPTLFAPLVTEAAFTKGEQYREELVKYIEGNVLAVEDALKDVPGIKALRPQASFLVWLDCRGLGLDHDSLVDLFVNKARLALNDGAMFGSQGSGFMRMNIGTSRSEILRAMDSLKAACKERK
jgi:Bifunctional PLP-dependent enzyme with beta-cystathionase and maltose regulon repressor activities